mmetsp:Transcript_17590/g.56820  ORF Transcript_17590/g.56820 Transcript_17590/m.56820 type:complete len:246 (+) Transcript_17590:500-1237(+)
MQLQPHVHQGARGQRPHEEGHHPRQPVWVWDLGPHALRAEHHQLRDDDVHRLHPGAGQEARGDLQAGSEPVPVRQLQAGRGQPPRAARRGHEDGEAARRPPRLQVPPNDPRVRPAQLQPALGRGVLAADRRPARARDGGRAPDPCLWRDQRDNGGDVQRPAPRAADRVILQGMPGRPPGHHPPVRLRLDGFLRLDRRLVRPDLLLRPVRLVRGGVFADPLRHPAPHQPHRPPVYHPRPRDLEYLH